MNNNYILILLFIAIIYLYTQNKNIKENMANTESIKEQIEEGIKEYYKADVNAIRNLSEVSKKLQAGGLEIPGDLTVKGNFNYLPKGTIVAYNSQTAPKGWVLCDGKNGTPDLRGRFIRMFSNTLGGFNSWGGKIVSGNRVSYSDTISGNSRKDKNSFILKHNFGDKAGTDHQTLSYEEMPSHNHHVNLKTSTNGNHTHYYSSFPNGRGNIASGRYWKSGGNRTGAAGNHNHTVKGHTTSTGKTWGHNNQPPYYVLSYIMKL